MENHKYSYTKIKFYLATKILATSQGDARRRLLSAYTTYLYILTQDDFPDSMKQDWNWIVNSLTKKGLYEIRETVEKDGEMKTYRVVLRNKIENTLHHMQNRTAEKIALRIFDMFLILHGLKD